MITGELPYFFIREVALALHQQAAQHHPALLPFLVRPFAMISSNAVRSSFTACGGAALRGISFFTVKHDI